MLLEAHPSIVRIVRAVHELSGKAYLVGGAVRDLVLGLEVYDMDIEVHGVMLDTLSALLAHEGPVSFVGKSFGVLKLHGTRTDWSVPRSDRGGRKPEVTLDPSMNIVEALRRRDLTMNAMAIDLTTHEFVDPFHGLEDLKQGILRSPDIDFFCEDPLRFYRVMQFIGRFSMYPDELLEKTCSEMEIRAVSVERIEGEFEKLLLKSKRPSLGIRWLANINRLKDILPELADTLTTEQDLIWHPEGTVFEHLMQALDAAVLIDKGTPQLNLILRYAALCHDLGKVSTTRIIDGRVTSRSHAEVGVPLVRALLKHITRNVKLIDTVSLLVKYHMQPGQFVQQDSSLAAYRRLALKLAPLTNLDMLLSLSIADRRGRNPHSQEPLTSTPAFVATFLQKAQEADVLHEPEKPILQGHDISDLVAPGPLMGELLRYAFQQQIERSIKSKELLKQLLKEKLHSLK
jgi:tRNA nucleotidyltransferase (CCA-adding enzyme)